MQISATSIIKCITMPFKAIGSAFAKAFRGVFNIAPPKRIDKLEKPKDTGPSAGGQFHAPSVVSNIGTRSGAGHPPLRQPHPSMAVHAERPRSGASLSASELLSQANAELRENVSPGGGIRLVCDTAVEDLYRVSEYLNPAWDSGEDDGSSGFSLPTDMKDTPALTASVAVGKIATDLEDDLDKILSESDIDLKPALNRAIEELNGLLKIEGFREVCSQMSQLFENDDVQIGPDLRAIAMRLELARDGIDRGL
ncbi:MAG TPA: hypothetical protein VGO76_19545 [Luteibacter sp.]|jgi:hypothetical protein|nr:hypothetical protein [Luteibacter sp.]